MKRAIVPCLACSLAALGKIEALTAGQAFGVQFEIAPQRWDVDVAY